MVEPPEDLWDEVHDEEPSPQPGLRKPSHVAEWAGPPKEKKNKSAKPAQIKKWAEQMMGMRDSGDWSSATPVHLVALYVWCHTEIYQVAPTELVGETYSRASILAGGFVRTQFNGDFADAVEFLKWCWKRETGRERWRRENKQHGRRIDWRLQFSPTLVTDYRIDRARQSKES